jgi:hypothetical protein
MKMGSRPLTRSAVDLVACPRQAIPPLCGSEPGAFYGLPELARQR